MSGDGGRGSRKLCRTAHRALVPLGATCLLLREMQGRETRAGADGFAGGRGDGKKT